MKDAQALGSFRGAFKDKYNLNISLTENATDEKNRIKWSVHESEVLHKHKHSGHTLTKGQFTMEGSQKRRHTQTNQKLN